MAGTDNSQSLIGHVYDVIVVGLGGVGSSACYALAKRGLRILGIDQYHPPHSFGSSHGDTRIIRKSYFEHPDYVPLLQVAYPLWREIEDQSQRQLYFPTGLLEIGPGDGVVIQGILQSASQHQLPIERWTMAEARKHFPCIEGDPRWQAIYEKDAGYLLVEQCVATYLEQAARLGATLRYSEKVLGWEPKSNAVCIQLEKETIHAKKLILCAGPWAGQVLAGYQLPMTVLRKHLYWYRCEGDTYHESQGFPCFFYDTPEGFFYGFPVQGELGLKVARHSGGAPIHVVDGTHVRDSEDQNLVESFLRSYLPGVLGSQSSSSALSRWSGCYYTMTPDEHFVVDRLPDLPQVVVTAGLSGHGFKFTSVLGEVACRLVMDEEPGFDIRFLGIDRFLGPRSNY